MRLLRDGAAFVAAKFIPGALGIATTAVLTRTLPPTSYGRYGAALLVGTVGGAVLFDWIGLAFMRLHEARAADRRTLPTFAALFAAASALVLAVGTLAVLAGAVPRADRPLAAASLALLWAGAAFELLARVEIARFRPWRYLRMNCGRALLVFAAAAASARLTGSATATAASTAAALALALALGPVRTVARRPFRIDRALAREAIRFGLPFAGSAALLALSTSLWRAVVGAFGGSAALGVVTAAAAVAQNTLVLLAAAIGAATYPRAVRRLEAGDRAAFERQLAQNWTVLFAALLPAAIGLALLADPIAVLLTGPAYRDGVARLIPPLAIAALLSGLRSFHLDHAFQLGRRPALQLRVAAGAGVVGLGLGLALVPFLGPLGAALALGISMATSCIHAIRLGRLAEPMPIPLGPTLAIAAATAAMAGAVLATPGSGVWGLLARIAAGGVAYGATLALLLDMRGSAHRSASRLDPVKRWAFRSET